MARSDKKLKRAKKLAAQRRLSRTKAQQENREGKLGYALDDPGPPNPYLTEADLVLDIQLAEASVNEFYDSVPDDVWSSSEDSPDQSTSSSWWAVFREKMTEKYGDLETAKPFFMYAMHCFVSTLVDETQRVEIHDAILTG